MKTSNKILFSFLGFAWLSIMVVLLVSFRFSNLRGLSIIDKVEVEEWPISGSYSVVSIQDSWMMILEREKEGVIQYSKYFTSDKRGKELEDPDPFIYEVKNDTLFVKGMKQKPNGSFSIQVGDIKSILLENVTEARLRGINMDSLTVTAITGHLLLDRSHGVGYLNFDGKEDSRLQVVGIPSLKLSLDQSKAEIYGNIGKIFGGIINRSEVILPTQSGKLDLAKDENSKISIEDAEYKLY